MSKQGDSRRIARRVICLGPARLRNLLFVPLMIAWALLGVGLGRSAACAGAIAGQRRQCRAAYRGDD